MKNLSFLAIAFLFFVSTFTSCTDNEGLITNRQIDLTDTYDEVQNGVWLLMTYDATSDSFVGTVENTTSSPMENVRLEIQLSEGVGLNMATPIDLDAGEMKAVSIPANGEIFEKWLPYASKI